MISVLIRTEPVSDQTISGIHEADVRQQRVFDPKSINLEPEQQRCEISLPYTIFVWPRQC
jgi:hypothetical protein